MPPSLPFPPPSLAARAAWLARIVSEGLTTHQLSDFAVGASMRERKPAMSMDLHKAPLSIRQLAMDIGLTVVLAGER